MNNQAFTTLIKEEDLLFLEKMLEREKKPFSLAEMAERLAFQKTAGQREQPVLKYDPACRYEVGDLIYKEYDELLTIGAKQAELFQGGVVLKVIKKTYYPSYNCEILEVDYTGGGLFRKYFDYMKRGILLFFFPLILTAPLRFRRGLARRMTLVRRNCSSPTAT